MLYIDQCLDSRYKLIVQVVLGERHGAGTIVGGRCIWDADTDTCASDQFLNVCKQIIYKYNNRRINYFNDIK